MIASSLAAMGLSTSYGMWVGWRTPNLVRGRYGQLRADRAGILDLLEGFRYEIVERAGGRMDDGHLVPSRPDGMACFDLGDGTLALMRNHEIGKHHVGLVTTPEVPERYDPESGGGVTRVVLDAATLERRSSNLVLAGTSTNCSGGPSPLGWLSCEESVDGRHGYVFLCDPHADRVRPPQRLPALGRFRHEAAVMRASDRVTYLSEDRPEGCFYRFTPNSGDDPFTGRLEAMVVHDLPSNDTGGLARGATRPVSFVEISDVDAPQDDLRIRAQARGAAIVRRGEGLAVSDRDVFLCATAGGLIDAGQIFRIEDHGSEGQLEVLASSVDRAQLDMPDNVAVSPLGQLFFVEDGSGSDYLRGVDRDGEVFTLARNALSPSELAGVCTTPDGRALFVNLQVDGLTLRIDGPFERFV